MMRSDVFFVTCSHVLQENANIRVVFVEPAGPDLLGTLVCEQCLRNEPQWAGESPTETLLLMPERSLKAQIAAAKSAGMGRQPGKPANQVKDETRFREASESGSSPSFRSHSREAVVKER
jgi:hypothetical protein